MTAVRTHIIPFDDVSSVSALSTTDGDVAVKVEGFYDKHNFDAMTTLLLRHGSKRVVDLHVNQVYFDSIGNVIRSLVALRSLTVDIRGITAEEAKRVLPVLFSAIADAPQLCALTLSIGTHAPSLQHWRTIERSLVSLTIVETHKSPSNAFSNSLLSTTTTSRRPWPFLKHIDVHYTVASVACFVAARRLELSCRSGQRPWPLTVKYQECSLPRRVAHALGLPWVPPVPTVVDVDVENECEPSNTINNNPAPSLTVAYDTQNGSVLDFIDETDDSKPSTGELHITESDMALFQDVSHFTPRGTLLELMNASEKRTEPTMGVTYNRPLFGGLPWFERGIKPGRWDSVLPFADKAVGHGTTPKNNKTADYRLSVSPTGNHLLYRHYYHTLQWLGFHPSVDIAIVSSDSKAELEKREAALGDLLQSHLFLRPGRFSWPVSCAKAIESVEGHHYPSVRRKQTAAEKLVSPKSIDPYARKIMSYSNSSVTVECATSEDAKSQFYGNGRCLVLSKRYPLTPTQERPALFPMWMQYLNEWRVYTELSSFHPVIPKLHSILSGVADVLTTATLVTTYFPPEEAFPILHLNRLPINPLVKWAIMDALACGLVNFHARTRRSHNDLHLNNAMFNKTNNFVVFIDFALSTTVFQDSMMFDMSEDKLLASNDPVVNGRLFDVYTLVAHLSHLEGTQFEPGRATKDPMSYWRIFLEQLRYHWSQRTADGASMASMVSRMRDTGNVEICRIAEEAKETRVRNCIAAYFRCRQFVHLPHPAVSPHFIPFTCESMTRCLSQHREWVQVARKSSVTDRLSPYLNGRDTNSAHTRFWKQLGVSADKLRNNPPSDVPQSYPWMTGTPSTPKFADTLQGHFLTEAIDAAPESPLSFVKRQPLKTTMPLHSRNAYQKSRGREYFFNYVPIVSSVKYPYPIDASDNDAVWVAHTSVHSDDNKSLIQWVDQAENCSLGPWRVLFLPPDLGTCRSAYGRFVSDLTFLTLMRDTKGFETIYSVQTCPEGNRKNHTDSERTRMVIHVSEPVGVSLHAIADAKRSSGAVMTPGFEQFLGLLLLERIHDMHSRGVIHGNLNLRCIYFDMSTFTMTITNGAQSFLRVHEDEARSLSKDKAMQDAIAIGGSNVDLLMLYGALLNSFAEAARTVACAFGTSAAFLAQMSQNKLVSASTETRCTSDECERRRKCIRTICNKWKHALTTYLYKHIEEPALRALTKEIARCKSPDTRKRLDNQRDMFDQHAPSPTLATPASALLSPNVNN